MKNQLIYQSTEYDCDPVTLTNAIRYLFDREEIHPDIVKYIMLYYFDTYDEKGEIGKYGTSATALMFLNNWLNQFGKAVIVYNTLTKITQENTIEYMI